VDKAEGFELAALAEKNNIAFVETTSRYFFPTSFYLCQGGRQ
jgi:hypothetical protein